jgi:large subunit ribosomal protein L4
MLQVPVYNTDGERLRTASLEEAVLGGHVRGQLLHDAVVMYEANRRVGTRKAKTRGAVAGTGRKMYRQKGTGYARAGSRRSPIRRGGGVAGTIVPRDYRQAMPLKARRLALASALLSKFQDGQALIVEGLAFETPRTKAMRHILDALGITESFLLVLGEPDTATYLSTRNIHGALVRPMADLNAYDVLRRRRLVLTPSAFRAIVEGGRRLCGPPRAASGETAP